MRINRLVTSLSYSFSILMRMKTRLLRLYVHSIIREEKVNKATTHTKKLNNIYRTQLYNVYVSGKNDCAAGWRISQHNINTNTDFITVRKCDFPITLLVMQLISFVRFPFLVHHTKRT